MVFMKSKLNSRFELYRLTKVRTYAQHVDDQFAVQASASENLESTIEVEEHREMGVSQHLVVFTFQFRFYILWIYWFFLFCKIFDAPEMCVVYHRYFFCLFSESELRREISRLGTTTARLKPKGIDGGLHKRWSMWFNSTQRAKPYQFLT